MGRSRVRGYERAKVDGGRAISTRAGTSCAYYLLPLVYPVFYTASTRCGAHPAGERGDDGRDGSQPVSERTVASAFLRDEISPSIPSRPSSVTATPPEKDLTPFPLRPLHSPNPRSGRRPTEDARLHAQAALPPPAPPPRRGRPLLPGRPGCGGRGVRPGGGAHGADGPGWGVGVQRGGAERDAAAAGELPALRALHLLRRAQGRLRPLPVLLRHQLQHPQPPLRILLLHAQVMRLPPLQRLS